MINLFRQITLASALKYEMQTTVSVLYLRWGHLSAATIDSICGISNQIRNFSWFLAILGLDYVKYIG